MIPLIRILRNPIIGLILAITSIISLILVFEPTLDIDPTSANRYDLQSIEKSLLTNFPYDPGDQIERQIWQLWSVSNVSDPSFPQNCAQLVKRWREGNQDYKYHLISLAQASAIAREQLGKVATPILEALDSMPDERLQYEYMKYILMFLQGGVYADIDTLAVKSIKLWRVVPQASRLVLGVDSDYNYKDWRRYFNRRMVLSSSIFMVKQHHPMLAKLIARICYISFSQWNTIQKTNWTAVLENYDVNGDPVVQFTGQSVLTDTFFDYGSNLDVVNESSYDAEVRKNTIIVGPSTGNRFSYRNITGISRPVELSDGSVILPQICFHGFENSHDDMMDDKEIATGYEALFYGRPMSLTQWSHRKIRFDSN